MQLSYKNILFDEKVIPIICKWYFNEWKIDEELTKQSLAQCGLQIPLHIVVYLNDQVVATGGIYNEVGLHKIKPEYKKYKPWMALLYTIPELRGKGIGSFLCDSLEKEALNQKVERYFLFTSSAQSLYERKGWQEIEKVSYKDKTAVVMEKFISATQQSAT